MVDLDEMKFDQFGNGAFRLRRVSIGGFSKRKRKKGRGQAFSQCSAVGVKDDSLVHPHETQEAWAAGGGVLDCRPLDFHSFEVSDAVADEPQDAATSRDLRHVVTFKGSSDVPRGQEAHLDM